MALTTNHSIFRLLLHPLRSLRPLRLNVLYFISILCCLACLPSACSLPAGQTADPHGLPLVIGSRGIDPGHFSSPRGIDIDSAGRVAVADRSGRIILLSPEGKWVRDWKMPKMDNGTPTGIVFDQSDPATETLLVADTHNSRIMRYGLDGRMQLMFGEYGGGPGQMIYVTDLAVDPAGNMFITEYGQNDRVMVYDRQGKFVRQWGGFGTAPGQFQRPLALVYQVPDKIIVADSCNHRIQVFKTDGTLLAVWGGVGNGPGQFNYPYDLTAGKDGNLTVLEYGNNRIQCLNKDGKSIALYGKPGTAPGDFGAPWGIATAPDGRLWVADTLNHRLQVFRPEIFLGQGLKRGVSQ